MSELDAIVKQYNISWDDIVEWGFIECKILRWHGYNRIKFAVLTELFNRGM